MIGVDLHEGMLERAKQKAKEQSLSIEFIEARLHKLAIPVKSSLVFMTGNSFQHFLRMNYRITCYNLSDSI